MTILVTGSAGFIGFHLCKRLIKSKESLICIDNFNDYYDVNLKNSRADYLSKENEKYKGNYELLKLNIFAIKINLKMFLKNILLTMWCISQHNLV